MDEDSDWGSWGLDPAATRIQQQRQQQQQSGARPTALHAATSGKTTSNGTAAAHPTSSNGNVKSAPKKLTSRQSSITRLSTITDDWRSLLADTTAAPIKVQASKARPTHGLPKLQGAVSTHPSSVTGKATSGPTPMSAAASTASQSAQLPSAVSAGHTDGAGSTAASDTSGITTVGPKASSRVAGQAADLQSDSQRAISLESFSASATTRSRMESTGPAEAGHADLRTLAPSIIRQQPSLRGLLLPQIPEAGPLAAGLQGRG
ncbi:hypothetical protein WJX79_009427 [Trebouxia sp. C0005]